ncbi:MAG: 30S ribosomal protein S16 [Spirochaetota bacterium]|nr:30S ribosomal protein S16 [Spirochaetota bacterium]
MSVKIRLQRVGTKKKPFYRIVAVDSRKKRGGEVIEYLGKYHPISKGDQFDVKEENVINWLQKGAVPTETTERLLKRSGIWEKFKHVK